MTSGRESSLQEHDSSGAVTAVGLGGRKYSGLGPIGDASENVYG